MQTEDNILSTERADKEITRPLHIILFKHVVTSIYYSYCTPNMIKY